MPVSGTVVPYLAAAVFGLALIHTFSTGFFERLARRGSRHAGLWHLLGEVEIVFGLWAAVLAVLLLAAQGRASALAYLEGRDFTEPMFVFAVMLVAASRPILQLAGAAVRLLARALPLPRAMAGYFAVLCLVPLLGSFITEPAAMTLAALMLRDDLLAPSASQRFKYLTVGVLFVNVSIGGVLTPFAAPPVLMVSAAWGWDTAYMLGQFGWKAALAVVANAALATWLGRRELVALATPTTLAPPARPVPRTLLLVHLGFLVAIVLAAHHPVVFLGLLLLFFGVAGAYRQHQSRLIVREALLVACFLSGLVVLGGLQQWWLQPLLLGMEPGTVFLGTTALTAFTDNAALTYLASLVPGLSEEFKVALVAGAVTGGGLTVIANAPNPAGLAILRERFTDRAIRPLGLLLAALPPTALAACALRLL